ncbi:hypothetical protein JMG10_39945 [Nostoc ellipsosporum NOK]|nr:hypothetical protein [Nostoc ellipsosporum NOK]
MYLSEIIKAISLSSNSPALDFDQLPPSLEAYYQQHLQQMLPANFPSQGRKLQLSVLSVLVQLLSPVSAAVIANSIDADEYDVEEVLENWREFLTLQHIDGEIRYSLYHSSFRDFLSNQLNLGYKKPD